MAAITMNDAYVTNAGASSSSALGAGTVQADTLVVVASAVAFLASDASGMMTGTIVDMYQSVLGCHDSAPQPPAAMRWPD